MEDVAGQSLKELRYLSEFSVAERVKFLWLLALDLKRAGRYEDKIPLQILAVLNPENIHIILNSTKTEIKDVQFIFPEDLRATEEMDVTKSKSHVRLFGVIASQVFPPEDDVNANLHAFIGKMISADFHQRPPFSEVLQFFTELNNGYLLEQSFENASDLSHSADDVWKMFFYDSKYFVNKENIWRKCAVEIAKNITAYTGVQAVKFFRELDRRSAEETPPSPSKLESVLNYFVPPAQTLTELRNTALQTFIPQLPEDYFQLFLYLSEGQNYKGYENKLTDCAASVVKNITGGDVYSAEQCLGYFRIVGVQALSDLEKLSPEKQLSIFSCAEPDEAVWKMCLHVFSEHSEAFVRVLGVKAEPYLIAISSDERLRLFLGENLHKEVRAWLTSNYKIITSDDGKRIYCLDVLSQNVAYLVDPLTNQPDPTRKFYVTAFKEEDRSYYQKRAEKLQNYFETEMASTYLITEYSDQQDWSVYDGRAKPKDLPLVDRLTLLCDMLRELAEKQPPSRDYIWLRGKIEELRDIRPAVDQLLPVILHYLGDSDPFREWSISPIVAIVHCMERLDFNGHNDRFRSALKTFLVTMTGEHKQRPNAQALLQVFEAVREYCVNPSEENVEVLECTTSPAAVFDYFELPHSFKSLWLLFLHASQEKNYHQNLVKWERLTQTILERMNDCTDEQANIFLGIIFSRGAKQLKAIDIDALNMSKTRKQQLSDVIELARMTTERTLEQRMRLFRFAEQNTPYYHYLLDELDTPDLDLPLYLAAADAITRLKYERKILANFNVYTSQQLLTFVQAVESVSLQNKIIEKLVNGLKFYKENLFYFNPRRFTVTKQIRALERGNFAELNGLPEKLTQTVPLKYITSLKNSRRQSKRYDHYELVKVNANRFYVVDFKKIVGAGSFGTVYEAYRVNPVTGELGEKFAVKVLDSDFKKILIRDYSPDTIEKEVKALQKNFFVEEPIRRGFFRNTYVISEFAFGKSLTYTGKDGLTYLNPQFRELSIEERLKAIVMMAGELNRSHHTKIGNNKKITAAYVHGDINPLNINVLIEDKHVKDLRVLDYGLATELVDDDPTRLVSVIPGGADYYVSPEVIRNRQSGIKSDIRSWVPVILRMLSVPAPLYGTHVKYLEWTINNTYSFEGIFSGMKKDIPLQLQVLIIQFLKKMASYEYQERPSSDDALIFFNAIYNYFQCKTGLEKDSWVSKNEELIEKYTDNSLSGKWALFLYLTENNDHGDKNEVDVVLRELVSQLKPETLTDQLKLLVYFNIHREDNDSKENWQALIKNMCELEAEPQNYHSVLLTLFEDLSKTKDYPKYKGQWKMLAEIIATNISEYTGQEMLTFLRKLNKFNKKGDYNDIRKIVVDKLMAGLLNNPDREDPRAKKKVEDAVTADFRFFTRYRTKTALRSCASEVADEQVKSVVNRLGKVGA